MTGNQKKNQAIETDPEIIEMMELAEKDIKNHYYKYVPLAQRCKGKYEHERNRKCFFFKKELKMKITLDDIYGNFDTTYKRRKFENTAINLFRIKHRGKKLSSPWHAPGQNTGVGSLSPTRLK